MTKCVIAGPGRLPRGQPVQGTGVGVAALEVRVKVVKLLERSADNEAERAGGHEMNPTNV